jgi:hypothetical protein
VGLMGFVTVNKKSEIMGDKRLGTDGNIDVLTIA